MPAIVVSKVMRPQRRDIYVTVMDDYAAEMHLTLPVTMSKTDRDAKIKSALQTMNEGQAAMEAQAKIEGMDISALKSTGTLKRDAATKKGQK
jgi:hypothetical protein